MCEGLCKTVDSHYLTQSLPDTFKIGIIALFGQMVKLMHRKVKNMPDYTQEISPLI